jgi:hypothetical protein
MYSIHPVSLSPTRLSHRIGHLSASPPQRLRCARRGVLRRLMLHLGIDLGAQKHNYGRKPEPRHEADNRPKRTVGFVELAETGGVP